MNRHMLALALLSGLTCTVPLLAQAPAGAATYRVTIVSHQGSELRSAPSRLM